MKLPDLQQADAALAAGDYPKAWQGYEKFLASRKENTKIPESLYVNAGVCLRRMNRQPEAVLLLKKGLSDYPYQASLHNNLANSLLDQEADRWEILHHYLQAGLLGEERQSAAFLAAQMLSQLNYPLAAYQVLHQWWSHHASVETPDLAMVSLLLELAITLFDEEDLAPISTWCLEYLERSDTDANQILSQKLSMMVAFGRSGRAQEALRLHAEIAALIDKKEANHEESQVFINASWNLAIVLLGAGKMQPGWKLYEYGLRCPSKGFQRWQRALPKLFSSQQVPLWRGEEIAGQRLMLMSEQAVGDTMMFLQLLPELFRRDIKLTLVLPDRLEPIYARTFPQCRVISHEDAESSLSPDDVDFQCPVGSLPQYILSDWVESGNPQTKLSVDAARRDRLRRTYRKGMRRDRPLIGISWSGGGKRERMRVKSVTTDQIATLMKRLDGRFLSLQYGDHRNRIQTWQREGIDIIADDDIDALKDMDSWLSQVATCDLVISVANTTIHGAALVGIPTFCLLSRFPDWRWTQRQPDGSYWYDTVEVGRQTRTGDWQPALDAAFDWVEAMRGKRYVVESGSAHRQSQSLDFHEWLQ